MTLRLTDRDRSILRDVWLFRYATTEQLARLHFSNLKVAQRRLRKLADGGLLDRFSPRESSKAGFHPWWYRLGRPGARALSVDVGLPVDHLLPPKRSPQSNQFLDHHREVNDFRVWLRRAVSATEGRFRCRFVPEYSEVEDVVNPVAVRTNSGKTVNPDGAFCLERVDGRSALFLLEVDRGTEPLEGRHPNSIIRKLGGYRSMFDEEADGHYADMFGKPFRGFRVLFVVPDSKRGEAIRKCSTRAELEPLVWTCRSELLASGAELVEPVWSVGAETEQRLPLTV